MKTLSFFYIIYLWRTETINPDDKSSYNILRFIQKHDHSSDIEDAVGVFSAI